MTILILKVFILFLACRANSDELGDLVLSNNDFGLKLYKVLKTGQGNIIFSPLSISLALAITSMGAKGRTLEEIRNSAFSGFPEERIYEQFQHIMKVFSRNDGLDRVIISNLWYAQRGFEILLPFRRSSQKLYKSELLKVDFRRQDIAWLINNSVANRTGKITKIVTPDDLTERTRLILINALHFKARWAFAFQPGLKLQTFYVTPGKSVQTEFLHDSKMMCYYGVQNTLHFEVLEKPFLLLKFTFGIVLPDLAKTSLDQVEKDLSADALKSLKLEKTFANITIPKLRFQSIFELSEDLKKLGINDLFLEGRGDLSGIEKLRGLYVSKVLHQAVIEIDENGVDGAGTTVFVVAYRPSFKPNIINFTADHPFLFYIKHVGTGSILFLGRFIQP